MLRPIQAPSTAQTTVPWHQRALTTNLASCEIHVSEVAPDMGSGVRLSVDGNFAHNADQTQSFSSLQTLRAPQAAEWTMSNGIYHADGEVSVTAMSPDGRLVIQTDGIVSTGEETESFGEQFHRNQLQHLRFYDLTSPTLSWFDAMPWRHYIFPSQAEFLSNSQACWVEPGNNDGMTSDEGEEIDYQPLTLLSWDPVKRESLIPTLPESVAGWARPASIELEHGTYIGFIGGERQLMISRYSLSEVHLEASVSMPASVNSWRLWFSSDGQYAIGAGPEAAAVIHLDWAQKPVSASVCGIARYKSLPKSDLFTGLHHWMFDAAFAPTRLAMGVPSGSATAVYAVPIAEELAPEEEALFLGYWVEPTRCGLSPETGTPVPLGVATTFKYQYQPSETRIVHFWRQESDGQLTSTQRPVVAWANSIAMDISAKEKTVWLQSDPETLQLFDKVDLFRGAGPLCCVHPPEADRVFVAFCHSPIDFWLATLDAPRERLLPRPAFASDATDDAWPIRPLSEPPLSRHPSPPQAESSATSTPVPMNLRFWSVLGDKVTLRRSHSLLLDATAGAEMHFAPNATALLLWSFLPGHALRVLHFLSPSSDLTHERLT